MKRQRPRVGGRGRRAVGPRQDGRAEMRSEERRNSGDQALFSSPKGNRGFSRSPFIPFSSSTDWNRSLSSRPGLGAPRRLRSSLSERRRRLFSFLPRRAPPKIASKPKDLNAEAEKRRESLLWKISIPLCWYRSWSRVETE